MKPVIVSPRASLQILELDAWWRENRDKAPARFSEELASALKTIGDVPTIGKHYPHPRASVRRLLLRSSNNHVYYVERDDHVRVLAVWGGIKESGPDLTSL